MKKLISILLCFVLLLSASACGKKYKTDDGATLNDIPTATADHEDEVQDEKSEEVDPEDASDRTPETDRGEVEANLRDARDLIESGDYDDASMIISSLKTRSLTDEEGEELNELQQMMLQVSD